MLNLLSLVLLLGGLQLLLRHRLLGLLGVLLLYLNYFDQTLSLDRLGLQLGLQLLELYLHLVDLGVGVDQFVESVPEPVDAFL